MVWSLQDAKNKFSEVVDRARSEGPQKVQRHGRDAVYIVSSDDWLELQARKSTLADFFRESPLSGTELVIERDKSPSRPVDL